MKANWNPAVYNLMKVQVTDKRCPLPDNVNVEVIESLGVVTARDYCIRGRSNCENIRGTSLTQDEFVDVLKTSPCYFYKKCPGKRKAKL